MLHRTWTTFLVAAVVAGAAPRLGHPERKPNEYRTQGRTRHPPVRVRANNEMSMTLPGGDRISLYIDESAAQDSVHGSLECQTCAPATLSPSTRGREKPV